MHVIRHLLGIWNPMIQKKPSSSSSSSIMLQTGASSNRYKNNHRITLHMLQYALLQQWQHDDSRKLSISAYLGFFRHALMLKVAGDHRGHIFKIAYWSWCSVILWLWLCTWVETCLGFEALWSKRRSFSSSSSSKLHELQSPNTCLITCITIIIE